MGTVETSWLVLLFMIGVSFWCIFYLIEEQKVYDYTLHELFNYSKLMIPTIVLLLGTVMSITQKVLGS